MKRRIRLTESDLHNIIRKSVKKVLMEAKLDDPHGALSSINDMWGNLSKDISKGAIEYNKKSNYPIESGLAQLIVDNGLSIDDVKQYKELIEKVCNFNDYSDENMFITLSRFIPTDDDLKRINEYSFYEIGSKRGRDKSGEIRKQVRFFKEGSVFPNFQLTYGNIVKSGEINPAFEYGYAYPFRFKKEMK